MFKRIKEITSYWLNGVRGKSIYEESSIGGAIPFGLTAGGFISFDKGSFVLLPEELDARYPGADLTIERYGKATIDKFVIHRFYFQSESDYLFQIITDRRTGVVDEIKLFWRIDKVNYQSLDDRYFWLGEEDGSIGLPTFENLDEQIYRRSFDFSNNRLPPLGLEEEIYPSGDQKEPKKIRHQMMLYERMIAANDSDVVEFILLSSEQEGGREWLNIYKGIELKETDFSNPLEV